MAEFSEDYWPSNFTTLTEDPAPVALLKEQAKLLSKKTGGRVEGVVKYRNDGGDNWYSLYLHAPTLGDYMFNILSIYFPISQGATNPFPLKAHEEMSEQSYAVLIRDMDHFKNWLRATLSSDSVASVVGNLLRLSEPQTT